MKKGISSLRIGFWKVMISNETKHAQKGFLCMFAC